MSLISIQQGTFGMLSGETSDLVSVSSYTAANSILLFTSRGGGTQGQNSTVRGIKLNSTSLLFNVATTGTVLDGEWYLLEFDTDVDVQDFTASGPGNQAISAVTLSQAFMVPLGVEIPSGTGFGAWENFRLSFVNSTTVNVAKGGTGTTGYQVVDMVGASVQEVTTATITAGNQNDAAISSVSLPETIHFASFSTTADAHEFDNQYRSFLSSATNWQLQRTEGGTQPDQIVTAHIVELPVGEWSVNRGIGSMPTFTTAANINTVVSDISNAFPRTTSANGNNSINATDGANTNYNQAMATAKQTAVGNLLLQRSSAGSALNYAWEVAESLDVVVGQIRYNPGTLSNGSATSPPTLTSQLGDNRVAILMTSEEEQANNPSDASIGGQAMTKVADSISVSGLGNTTTLWALLDADYPVGAGPHAVSVTGLGSGAAITVYEIENAVQVVPLEGSPPVDTTDGAGVTSLTTAPTGLAGNFIACAINSHGGDGNPWDDPPTGDGVWIRTFNNPATSTLSVGAHQVFLADPGGAVTLTESVSGGAFNRGSACNATFAEFQEVETGDIDNAVTEPAEVAIVAEAIPSGDLSTSTEPSEVAIDAEAVSAGDFATSTEPSEVAIASSVASEGAASPETAPVRVAIVGGSQIGGSLAAQAAPAEALMLVAVPSNAAATMATEPADAAFTGAAIAGGALEASTEPPEVSINAAVAVESSFSAQTEPAEVAIVGGPVAGGSTVPETEPAEVAISGGTIAGCSPLLVAEPAEAAIAGMLGEVPTIVLAAAEPAEAALLAAVTMPSSAAVLASEPSTLAITAGVGDVPAITVLQTEPPLVSIQAQVFINATLAVVAPPARVLLAAENLGILAPVLELHSEVLHSLDI